MRKIWSEAHKRLLWRKIWLSIAEVQAEFNLITTDEIEELTSQVTNLDIDRSLDIEANIHHDLMAELKCYAEQCPSSGGKLHMGATSMDIEDNADAIRIRSSLEIVLTGVKGIILKLASLTDRYADLPTMAYTHLQPAEPTTLGYRFAFYLQDIFESYLGIKNLTNQIHGKGFKGAVGTGASFMELVGKDQFDNFEQRLSRKLGLEFFSVTTQTAPRRQEYLVISSLADLAAICNKFAFDVRLLQSPLAGELSEPFGSLQVGSSAMPFKKNPILSEKISSLSRVIALSPITAWNNAAQSLLERTLDDSANRRTLLPETFLAMDEIILMIDRILSGLNINTETIQMNFNKYAPFSGIEKLIMGLVTAGADRQEMHELLRKISLKSWEDVIQGKPDQMIKEISDHPAIQAFLGTNEIMDAFKVEDYTGIASVRARNLTSKILSSISKSG
jgi:adenylosuccinate lyase